MGKVTDRSLFTAEEVAEVVRGAVSAALAYNPHSRTQPLVADMDGETATRLQQYVGAVITEGTSQGGPNGERWQAAIRHLEELVAQLRRGELPNVVRTPALTGRPPPRRYSSKVI